MRFGKIKADTPVPLPHTIHEKKNRKTVTLEEQEKEHTNIIPDIESTM